MADKKDGILVNKFKNNQLLKLQKKKKRMMQQEQMEQQQQEMVNQLSKQDLFIKKL